jgi:hypothetical protein
MDLMKRIKKFMNRSKFQDEVNKSIDKDLDELKKFKKNIESKLKATGCELLIAESRIKPLDSQDIIVYSKFIANSEPYKLGEILFGYDEFESGNFYVSTSVFNRNTNSKLGKNDEILKEYINRINKFINNNSL